MSTIKTAVALTIATGTLLGGLATTSSAWADTSSTTALPNCYTLKSNGYPVAVPVGVTCHRVWSAPVPTERLVNPNGTLYAKTVLDATKAWWDVSQWGVTGGSTWAKTI